MTTSEPGGGFGGAPRRGGDAGDSQQGSGGDLTVGDEVEIEIGPVAHGGSCVARWHGRVIFVRYALPGERAVVRLTEVRPGSFCRGEAVRVLRADPRRVPAPCAHFGPGGCGGCDWQHASADLQRELKASVVSEQLRRLAGIERQVAVEALPGGGFGWRGRVRWATDDAFLGPRRFRSHEVVPISVAAPCLIAAPGLSEAAERWAGKLPKGVEVVLVARDDGRPVASVVPAGGSRGPRPANDPTVTEPLAGRAFRRGAAGFWQAHRHAAARFVEVVADLLRGFEVTGGVAWDLYGGVGLFAPVLAAAVGPGGAVVTVESDRAASAHAADNLADLRQVTAVTARVGRFVADNPGAVDVVLLDPPRTGAGRHICEALAERRPAVIIYVACDPAALARDTAVLRAAGYELDLLRAFDAFPQTHHVECLASFTLA